MVAEWIVESPLSVLEYAGVACRGPPQAWLNLYRASHTILEGFFWRYSIYIRSEVLPIV